MERTRRSPPRLTWRGLQVESAQAVVGGPAGLQTLLQAQAGGGTGAAVATTAASNTRVALIKRHIMTDASTRKVRLPSDGPPCELRSLQTNLVCLSGEEGYREMMSR